MVNKHYYKNFRLSHSWCSGTLAINVTFSATAIAIITQGSSKWLMNETEGTSRLRQKGWGSKGNRRPLLEDRILQVLCISISRSNRCSDDDPEANGN